MSSVHDTRQEERSEWNSLDRWECPDCGSVQWTPAARHAHRCEPEVEPYDQTVLDETVVPAVLAYVERTGNEYFQAAFINEHVEADVNNSTVGKYLTFICAGHHSVEGLVLERWTKDNPTTYRLVSVPDEEIDP